MSGKKTYRLKIAVFFVSILLLSAAPWICAEESRTLQDDKTIPGLETIDLNLRELNDKIDYLLNLKTEQGSEQLHSAGSQTQLKVQALTKLHSSYLRLRNAIAALEQETVEQQTVQKIVDDFQTKGMSKKPPYSLAFYDSIKIDVLAILKTRQSIEHSIEAVENDILETKGVLRQKEADHRQALERYNKIENEEKKLSDIIENEITGILVNYYQIYLKALEVEKKKHAVEIANTNKKLELLKRQEQYVGSNIHYDEADLSHQLDIIEKNKTETVNEIERIRKDQTEIEIEYSRAQQKLSSAENPQEREIAQAYLKARNEWKETYRVVLELKQAVLQLLERQKTVWKQRYAVVKGGLSYEQKKEFKAETEKAITELNRALQIQQTYLNSLQNQIVSIDTLIQDDGTSPVGKKYLKVEKDATGRQFERRLEYQSLILASEQLEQNLLAQLVSVLDETSFSEQIQGILNRIRKVWHLEIWVVDQNSVSFGKIIIALSILVIGIIFSRFIMHRIYNRLLSTKQLKETTASAIYKGASYFAYLMIFLFALRMVNIPLTAFAFLGGAVAIGIGFGAQNLINNFISGFIILGERPINIGDLIEVDGLLGKVEEIGARCTRVRTGENVHKLIPNSSFLEKNITNWTLSDNKIRTKIVVGVAYGSPVEKVEQTLIESAKNNSKILQTPEPFVLFSDFGDNSLVFELYFWVMVRMVLEKKQIESQVRFEIDKRFRKENIVISFPQRDLHFDGNPLSIKLIHPEPSGTGK